MTMTRRMALILAAVVLLACGGSLTVHCAVAQQALQAQLAARNRDAASALALVLSQLHGDPGALRFAVSAQFDLGQYSRVELHAADGQPLVMLQRQTQSPGVPAWLVAAMPIGAPAGRAMVGDGTHDIGELQLESDASWAYDALWDTCSRAAALLAALAGVAALLAALALRAWQRPLRAVMAQARDLEQGRLVLAEEPRMPELRALTHSMNATVRRLREVFAAQADQVALLQRQAQLDAVTGLPLRHHFLARLQQRLAERDGPPVALLLIRVLHLDALNPRLGHEATDRLLGAVADVLMTYVDRVPGTFAGRLNGPDFALCLPVSGVALETAESLRAALAAVPAMLSGGAEAVVGGVDGLRDAHCGTALAAADAALARAEAYEGVAVEQHGELVVNASGARAWREQIAAALSERRAELAESRVVDQHGRTLHLECAMRVQLKLGGSYQAAVHWLALARRSRLLPRVDLMAVELALGAIAEDGQTRSVQASLVSLATAGFAAEVAALLQAAPQAAARLIIEVVDGARPAARVPLAAAAAAWRRHGVRMGAEHAGATAQQLPGLPEAGIDYVKVNARHLRGLASDAAVHDYASSLIALIHGLGLTVLAEGIDDPQDLAALWALGLDGATVTAASQSQQAP